MRKVKCTEPRTFGMNDDEEGKLLQCPSLFFQDLDQSVEHLILDCLQLDNGNGRDPRTCHAFYQFIYDRFQLAVYYGFLRNEDLLPYWEKYDDWAASAVAEFLTSINSSGKLRKFSLEPPEIPEEEGIHKLHMISRKRIETAMSEAFLQSRNDRNQYDLTDLRVRLDFFTTLHNVDSKIMNHYWHRLLHGHGVNDQLIMYLTVTKGKQKKSQKKRLTSDDRSSTMNEWIGEVRRFKQVYGPQWKNVMKTEQPEKYSKFLEHERRQRQLRHANQTEEQIRNRRLGNQIRSMRTYFRAKLSREGVATQEIEKRIAAKELEILSKSHNAKFTFL